MTTQVDLMVNLNLTEEQFGDVYRALLHRSAKLRKQVLKHRDREEMDIASDLDHEWEILAQVLMYMDKIRPLTD